MMLPQWRKACTLYRMNNILDLSDHIARRLMASEGAAARKRVASIERTARADGNMARARLAADVATRLPKFDQKGLKLDLLV
jgi:hypothetical protein